MKKQDSIFTKAVHSDIDLKENFGALSVPIYNASVFGFEDADEGSAVHNYEKQGYFYGRLGNPTQEALEKAVAALENAEAALAFSSGMAAISAAVLSNVRAGDHIVALASIYSTTTALFKFLAEKFDVETTFVILAAISRQLSPTFFTASSNKTRKKEIDESEYYINKNTI